MVHSAGSVHSMIHAHAETTDMICRRRFSPKLKKKKNVLDREAFSSSTRQCWDIFHLSSNIWQRSQTCSSLSSPSSIISTIVRELNVSIQRLVSSDVSFFFRRRNRPWRNIRSYDLFLICDDCVYVLSLSLWGKRRLRIVEKIKARRFPSPNTFLQFFLRSTHTNIQLRIMCWISFF